MSREKQIKEAKRWLVQADDDLEAAKVLGQNKKFAQACYFCQQAGEKAIKALWFYLGDDPWGHSILKLIEEITQKHIRDDFVKLIKHAAVLDKLYIPTRYPNGLPDLAPMEAYGISDLEIAISSAKILIQAVKDLL
jgi:HEPN domain-containing protein